jgi:hypothetical protein
VSANNGKGIFSGKMNGLYYAGIGAFSALDAFSFVMQNAAAFSVGKRPRGADRDACPLVNAGKAVDGDKFSRYKPAKGADFNRAFRVRIAFVVKTGADALTGKTAYTLVHVIRF